MCPHNTPALPQSAASLPHSRRIVYRRLNQPGREPNEINKHRNQARGTTTCTTEDAAAAVLRRDGAVDDHICAELALASSFVQDCRDSPRDGVSLHVDPAGIRPDGGNGADQAGGILVLSALWFGSADDASCG